MSNSEMIVQKIMETIQHDEELKKMTVVCNAEVQGRTASYPADLYLDFYANNGINYKIVIQAKDIDKEIDKNALFHFANMLQDISGQVMGVVFTQPVYDKLVQDVARDVGIMLYEMRNLADNPVWEAEIGEVRIDVDKEWVHQEKEKHHLEDTPIQSGGNPKYMFLYDDDDTCLDSIEGIFNSHIRARRAAGDFTETSIYHAFEDGAMYLKTDHAVISRVKLKGIAFALRFRNVTALDGEEIVNNILRTAFRAKLN